MAAVDLGASGGRVIAGRVSGAGVELHEVSRFPNEPVLAAGTLHWDILRLYAVGGSGLSAAAATFPLASAGIDSWGVDYGLLDAAGALIGNPVHYRDSRTDGVTVPVPAGELYAVTGIQHLPFNTIYQLAAAAGHAGAGGGADPAAHPGPARVLADRRGRRRGDERVHDRRCST